MNAPAANDDGLLLTGLDGSNPLAFLAALGTLRIIQRSEPSRQVTMAWVVSGSRYLPQISGPVFNRKDLIARLASTLSTESVPPWNLSKKLPFEADALRDAASRSVKASSISDRDEIDAIASLGSEVFVDDKGQFADTALRMVRSGDSAGQGMLDYAQKIRANTTTDDLQHALFEQWHHSPSGPSLRWDPVEAREYALLASDPSKDGALSVIGANRLALEAMPLFSTVPTEKGLATVAFHQIDSNVEMTWPLWTVLLAIPVIRSLLTLDCLSAKQIPADDLKARGVAIVFRSRLFKPNKYYSNLSSARAVLT